MRKHTKQLKAAMWASWRCLATLEHGNMCASVSTCRKGPRCKLLQVLKHFARTQYIIWTNCCLRLLLGKRNEETVPQREYTDSKQTNEKMFHIISSQENANWNHNEFVVHIYRDGRIQNSDHTKCWQGCRSLTRFRWDENGTILKNQSLEVSSKMRYTVTIGPNNCILGHLSQKNRNLCSPQYKHTNVHSSFICNSLALDVLRQANVTQTTSIHYWSIPKQ